jgi:hypothetical protein
MMTHKLDFSTAKGGRLVTTAGNQLLLKEPILAFT